MERTLNNSKTPHEKDKQQQQAAPTSQASIGSKKPTAQKGPTSSSLPTKHGKSSGSATAQAVKKLAQMPSGHTERGRGASRSVNYLSSTAASRAKAASTAQIHKPTASMSVNRLLVHGGAKSEGTLRRPRSVNNNNPVEDGVRRMVKGKSRSQAAFKSPVAAGSTLRRKSVASAEMLRSKSNNRKSPVEESNKKNKDEGGRKVSTDKVRSSSAAAIGRKATSSLSSTVSQKPSKQSSRRTSSRSGRLVRVTMNRTSELRAALHRPASGKRTGKSDTSSRSGSRKSYNRPNTTTSRDSKSKRRTRKRPSSDVLTTTPVLDPATKSLIDDNDNEREIFHV